VLKQKKGPTTRIRAAPIFEAYKGMRVVITKNLAPETGVANGAMGRISEFHFPVGTQFPRDRFGVIQPTNPPMWVDVILDNPPHVPFKDYPPNIRPVPLIEQSATVYCRNGNDIKRRTCTYDAIPIINGDAITGHASQGRTFKTTPVCIGNLFNGNISNVAMLFYVCCTRSTTANNLYFASPITLETLRKKCKMPPWIYHEWDRLKELSNQTIARLLPKRARFGETRGRMKLFVCSKSKSIQYSRNRIIR